MGSEHLLEEAEQEGRLCVGRKGIFPGSKLVERTCGDGVQARGTVHMAANGRRALT